MKRSVITILILDYQAYWRERTARILQDAGYETMTLATYEEAWQQSKGGTTWDLIVLGCASVSPAEKELVARMIARKQAIVVLSIVLSRQEMRALFLQGAADVADKTYQKAEILSLVEQVLERLTRRERSWALV